MESNNQSPSSSRPDTSVNPALPVVPKPQNKSERLTSLRLPRDLTLGGNSVLRQRARIDPSTNKTYVPNLNVTRNKNLDVKVSRDTREAVRLRGAGKRGDRGRGAAVNKRGGATPQQQASGFFSYGTGADGALKKRAQGRGMGRFGTSDKSEPIQKPKYMKNEIKYDADSELQLMKTILGDDDEDIEGNSSPSIKDADNLPILLTKTFKSWNIDDNNIKIKLENNLKVNIKNSDADNDVKPSVSDEFANLGFNRTVGIDENFYPKSVDELFLKQNSQIFLLQLPDTLPGAGINLDEEKKGNGVDEEKTEAESNENTKPSYCTPKSLNEGLIGKVVRYKSGRTQLVLGQSRFDLSLGMDAGFLQEVISINTNAEQRNGNMINLGQIKAKVNALPDWEHLFNELEKNTKNSAVTTSDTVKP